MNLCSVYNQCGGCKSLEISYEEQLKHKEDKVMKIMENKGITVEKYLGIKPSPEIYEYRNKMEYTFGDEFKDGPLNLGLRGRKKKFDVFYTKDCKICEEDFNKILIETTEFFRELKLSPRNYRRHTGYLRHLLVRKGKKTGEILLLLSTDVDETHDEAIKTWSEKILNLKLKGKIVTIYHCKSSSKASAIKPDVMTLLYGKETFEENLQ
jgi:tRNA/tmRNA/rRNA uracil-C5-methylase (TrmA/RlmC/RlmD family)